MTTQKRSNGKITRKKATQLLDKQFSLYIRWKHADKRGFLSCFTCGIERPVNEMYAGHFMSRKHRFLRWDERNVKPQCAKCNIFGHGEQYRFGLGLDRIQAGLSEQLLRESEYKSTLPIQKLLDLASYYEQRAESYQHAKDGSDDEGC
jgi:hypothetical protein